MQVLRLPLTRMAVFRHRYFSNRTNRSMITYVLHDLEPSIRYLRKSPKKVPSKDVKGEKGLVYVLYAETSPFSLPRQIYQFCNCTKALLTVVSLLGELNLAQMIALLPVELHARKVDRLLRIIKHEIRTSTPQEPRREKLTDPPATVRSLSTSNFSVVI